VNAIRRAGRVTRGTARDDRGRGQALVEFSIALIPFLFILMGIADLGRGIHMNNGVAQAAREIARTTSVHQCAWPCTTANYSAQMASTIATQEGLVPGLTDAGITVECVSVSDTVVTVPAGGQCRSGNYIRVTVNGSFRLVTPFVPIPNPMTLTSVAHVQVEGKEPAS
jgi:Flp pilus assembly protein TadG